MSKREIAALLGYIGLLHQGFQEFQLNVIVYSTILEKNSCIVSLARKNVTKTFGRKN